MNPGVQKQSNNRSFKRGSQVENLLTSANEHYLGNVVQLAQSHRIMASDDIYDARGVKLWSKGATITPALREKLVRHKLRKPVETSLSVDGGVTTAQIAEEARQLLDEAHALRILVGDKQNSVFDAIAQVRLHPVVVMLLTMARQNHATSFRHGVLAAIISAALGSHNGASHNEQTILALAGLVHDVGEMYINPDYIHSSRQLRPDEWRHVAVHPHIGQLLLEELTDYPHSVTIAVGEHHERMDGSGYPRQLSGQQISLEGQILSMAEMLSGIIVSKDNVLARSCIALKCVPGEHPWELVSTVSSLKKQSTEPLTVAAAVPDKQTVQKTHAISTTITLALAECGNIAPGLTGTPRAGELLHRVKYRLAELQSAMRSTGVEDCLNGPALADGCQENKEILLELDVVSREIEWRLRDIARSLYLHLSELDTNSTPAFNALIELLDKPV